MPADRRTRLLLGGVLAVLLYVVWGAVSGPDEPAPTTRPASTARRTGAAAAAGGDFVAPADVRIEDLTRVALTAGESARNPFVFGVKPPPPSAAGPRRTDPVSVPVPVTFAPAGPPPVPPIPFKFIGLVEGAAGRRIAVLSDTRGLVVHGSEGTIIDGRFRILAIGAETIDIAYADGRGRQTLRLTGQ